MTGYFSGNCLKCGHSNQNHGSKNGCSRCRMEKNTYEDEFLRRFPEFITQNPASESYKHKFSDFLDTVKRGMVGTDMDVIWELQHTEEIYQTHITPELKKIFLEPNTVCRQHLGQWDLRKADSSASKKTKEKNQKARSETDIDYGEFVFVHQGQELFRVKINFAACSVEDFERSAQSAIPRLTHFRHEV